MFPGMEAIRRQDVSETTVGRNVLGRSRPPNDFEVEEISSHMPTGPEQSRAPLNEQLMTRDRRRGRRRRGITVLAMSLAVLLVLGGGFVALKYAAFENSLHRSEVLANGDTNEDGEPVAPLSEDTNILLMGLDSRLDQQGNELAAEDYDALHSGDASTGGFNSNVLMLLHVPASGERATIMSIPRDDFVPLEGLSAGPGQAKIKQAYGYGYAEEQQRQVSGGTEGEPEAHQRSRDAGRTAQIETVSAFLDVHVDHFIEVTMVAFLDLARAVAPMTVCLNQATEDTYSGADFLAGEQEIDAEEAVAFVRQRRDTAHPELNFTDLDRSRRQQAFIASLAHQLKQTSTLTNPAKLQRILDAAESNIAVDSELNIIRFSRQATSLLGGDTEFVTLPIEGFGTSASGESINLVDGDKVRRTVKELIAGPDSGSGSEESSPGQAAGPSTTAAPSESNAPAPASRNPSSPAADPTSADSVSEDSRSYDDWHGPLQGGALPCVK